MVGLPASSPQQPPQPQARRAARCSPDAGLPNLLAIEEVAEHLGVNVRHIRRLVAERRVPYLKWGHLLRFDPAEIADWLRSQRVDPVDPTRRRRRR